MMNSLPAQEEIMQAHDWVTVRFAAKERVEPPFSFTYAGRPSAELLNGWQSHRATAALDGQRTEHTLTWSDPATRLRVRCVGVEYHDFPVVEWTVYFKNEGSSDTPVLEDIQALDECFEGEGEGEFVLHHHKGDFCTADGYEPYETVLRPGVSQAFAPVGGRGSNGAFPYYNLQMPGGGVILAVGWPGQWATVFRREEGNGVRIRAGQQLTHLRLHPGEEMRTPLIALLFWKGADRFRSQNLWRRWMLAHNMPRPGGQLPVPMLAANSSLQFNEMTGANEESQKLFISRYLDENIKPDYWWMDAGWYPCADESGNNHWPKVGTWEVDDERFPRGLRPISDFAHDKGIKTIVWFEPERIAPGTWLYKEHPEWLLRKRGQKDFADKESLRPEDYGLGAKLLDLGNPAAWEWLVNHVDRMLTKQGIDLYRQDFNFDPLEYWRANDSEGRQGATENHHVAGYLAYWDELRRRHPELLIDSCASGGRRNDLETLRRAVPLHKTDYNYWDLPAKQSFHYILALWMPFFGAPVLPVEQVESYAFRSAMCPCTVIGFDARRKDLDYGLLRTLIAQWRQVAHCFCGDYYPLTPYSRGEDVWMAWQFDCPERGEGLVQTFRRAESIYESARLKLRRLDGEAKYKVTNMDEDGVIEVGGRELMEQGLMVALPQQPQAAVIRYRRIGSV